MKSMRYSGTLRIAVLVLLVLAVAALGGVALLGCGAEEPAPAQTTQGTPGTYVTVDVQQTFEALNADEDAQIVDVREPDEWATTGIPVGAVLIPLGQLEERAPGELDKDKPVYVICNSGNRSRTGSEILLALGFTEVYNVAGGIQAWLKAGLAVEQYKP